MITSIIHVQEAWVGDHACGFPKVDEQRGALSHPMTPHWSVSMVVQVWWTAEFEGWGLKVWRSSSLFPPPVFHAHTNHILSLDRPSIFLVSCCIHSSSSSFWEEVATSPDKWKLRHASLVIIRRTRGCFEQHVSFRNHFLQPGLDSYQLNHKVELQQVYVRNYSAILSCCYYY